MGRRNGVTLVEVLVAIFIMGIGLLALLVLFPLGAINMAAAIRDDRAAHAAANAGSLASALDLRTDQNVVQLFTTPQSSSKLPTLSATTSSSLPYPVLVDPVGITSYPTAGPTSYGIPRVTPSNQIWTQAQSQLFQFHDDLPFDEFGQPIIVGGVIDGYPDITWAYLLKPMSLTSLQSVEVQIIVFSGRSTILPTENYYQADFNQGDSSVKIYYGPALGTDRPALKKGGWFLDATMTSGPAAGGTSYNPDPHGDFYRVADIVDGSDAQGTFVVVQIEGTFKHGTTSPYGYLLVMDNVIRVVTPKK